MRSLRFAPYAFVIALSPLSALADQPLFTGSASNDLHDPAIAYNNNADQYMVVYLNGTGTLTGALLDADGTQLAFFSDLLPSPGQIASPRVTYRPADDQYVVVAIETGVGFGETLWARGLDADGAGLWVQNVSGVTGALETPDVLGDTFSSCCTLVVWKQDSGAIKGRRYNSAGVSQGSGVFSIVADSGTTGPRAFAPRIAYQQQPLDDFAVVWQNARNGGLAGQIQARVVQPTTGSLQPIQTLAETQAAPWARFGQRFPGGVDIAYDEVGDRYYVAWRDESDIMLHRVSHNWTGGSNTIVFSAPPGSGRAIRAGTPEVVVADGWGKAFVSHPVSYDGIFGSGMPGYFVHGWWYSATGTFPASPLSTWWYDKPFDNVVAAFSPITETIFGIYEHAKPGFTPPTHDLWFELEDVP